MHFSVAFIWMVTHLDFIQRLNLNHLIQHNKQYHLNVLLDTGVSCTDFKVRTTFYSILNSTTWKYCSIAFIWMVTYCGFIDRHALKYEYTLCNSWDTHWSRYFYWINISFKYDDCNLFMLDQDQLSGFHGLWIQLTMPLKVSLLLWNLNMISLCHAFISTSA